MNVLFPDMPVNAGLEKVLAVVSDGIAKAAHPLMSLSFLILPVSLAVGIKLFQWLGPFAAAAAVLIPLTGLFAAESILAERTILPLSGEGLAAYSTGKPAYDDDGKDEDKANKTKDLLRQTHGGILPPEHNPTPYVPAEDSMKASKSRTKNAGTVQGTVAMQGSASLPQSATATASKQQAPAPAEAPQSVDLDVMDEQQAVQLNQVLGNVAETLFGSSAAPKLGKRSEALPYVNRIREEIGLSPVKDDSFSALLSGAKESAAIVGCE